MLRGFYTAASGMIAQQRRTELLTNNMSNANTPGYKSDQTSVRAFPEMLLNRMDTNAIPGKNGAGISSSQQVGGLNTGVYIQDVSPLFSQGDLTETSLKTDVSLADGNMPIDEETGMRGTVLFTVQDEWGELRYTRNGNFTLDADGYLTTASGSYVLDSNNQRIQLDNDQYVINEEGVLSQAGREDVRLGIAFSSNPYGQLEKEGDGLYRAAEGIVLPDAYNVNGADFSLKQGFLESSNVDESKTMTEMMMAYRSFEANQKVLQAYDKSMEKAVNEVGRIG
ncbi:flagellar hook-basal body protein [Bacillus massiliglaciei]|uniref:flagellar hook-basal body protein n=1 Tax=Bacillus massiliglaciei TaxID=1816693 RepID=UPI000AC5E41F|nr:flagellar hook-basal body protein [Bacillus massiliglaciei]